MQLASDIVSTLVIIGIGILSFLLIIMFYRFLTVRKLTDELKEKISQNDGRPQ